QAEFRVSGNPDEVDKPHEGVVATVYIAALHRRTGPGFGRLRGYQDRRAFTHPGEVKALVMALTALIRLLYLMRYLPIVLVVIELGPRVRLSNFRRVAR